MNDKTFVIQAVQSIIDEAEKMRNAYFFSAPQCAGMRRSYEKYHSHDKVTWTDGKDIFTAEYSVRCSCKNVYASGEYTKNGNKTTLTAIKNSLKRLQKEGA